MLRSFGQLVSDPGMEPRVRRALDRFARPYLWVTNEGITINEEGKLEIRLNGASLVQTVDGLRINPAGSPVIAGLTITGLDGYLFATNGVISAVSLSSVPSTLYSSVTQQGNTQPNETVLFNCLIPGGTLTATGDSVDFTVGGRFVSGSAQRLRVRLGTDSSGIGSNTAIFDPGSANYGTTEWSMTGSITRTSATGQKTVVTGHGYPNIWNTAGVLYSSFVGYNSLTETLANDLYLSVTGFHASTSNLVIGECFKVQKVPG